MSSFNKVILMGNVVKDPKVTDLDSGKVKATIRLAVTERYTSQGESRESTCFIDVVAWNKLAEACGERLTKGAAVLVEGKLRYEEWESDGGRRSRHTVSAYRMVFIPRGTVARRENEESGEGYSTEVTDAAENGTDATEANNGNS